MLLKLFSVFFKIGAFTFGGGYAMISLVKDECITKNKWISEEEFLNLITVAESTPGPIAINMATYIGYKKNKILGAIAATIGVVLPSLIVIYCISLFIKNFLEIKIIANAFYGIRIAVAIVIIKTALGLFNGEYKNSNNKKLTVFMFFVYAILAFIMDVFISNIFSIKVNSIFYVISAIILGILLLRVNKK